MNSFRQELNEIEKRSEERVLLTCIKNLMDSMNITEWRAMDILDIPKNDRTKYENWLRTGVDLNALWVRRGILTYQCIDNEV